MESSSYFKSACTRCGGHIEAPAEGAGMWIRCPHCGEKTQLIAPPPKLAEPALPAATPARKSTLRWVMILGLAFLVCGAIIAAGALFFLHTAKIERPTVIPSATTQPIAKPKSTKPHVAPQPDLWNGLKPGPITIEKPSNGKLMYAVGTIRNDTDKQRYGVKVSLDVLDENGEKIGAATDYTQFIDAHKEWTFRALVTSAKVKSAKVTAITEN